MVRDILVMEIRNVLRTQLYAVAALIGAAVMMRPVAVFFELLFCHG